MLRCGRGVRLRAGLRWAQRRMWSTLPDHDAYYSENLAELGTQTSNFPGRVEEDVLRDVLGNPVVLRYPLCSEAPTIRGVAASRRWRDVLASGPPVGLSAEEELQWRQEVIELHTIDEAVAEYRGRYAQVQLENKLAPSELLDRRRSQRAMVSARWFERLTARFHEDFVDWASGESARVTAARQRSAIPSAAMSTLVTSTSAGPRHVALHAIRREIGKWRTNAAEGSVAEVACVALLAAEERMQRLPPEAGAREVRRALELVGAVGSPTAQTERSQLLRTLRRAVAKGGGRNAADAAAQEAAMWDASDDASHTAASQPAVPDAIARAALGDDCFGRWTAESRLLAAYDKLLPQQLTHLAEHLAALTLNHVTSQLLQPTEVEGEKLTRLCIGLSHSVLIHFRREALVRHRMEQLHALEDLQVDAAGTASALDAEEPAEERAERLAMMIGFKRKQVEQTASFRERQVLGSIRGLRVREAIEVGPKWTAAQKAQLGGYLVRTLVQNAYFTPTGDEIARARQIYWQMVERIDCASGDDAAVASTAAAADDEWTTDAFAMAETLPDGWADQLPTESELMASRLSERHGPLFAPSSRSDEEVAALLAQSDNTEGAEDEGEPPAGAQQQAAEEQAAEEQAAEQAARGAAEEVEERAMSGEEGAERWRKYAPEPLPRHKLFEMKPAEAVGEDSADGEGGGFSAERPAAFCVYTKFGPSARKLFESSVPPPRRARAATYVCAHPLLYDTLVSGNLAELRHHLNPEAKPMLVPPMAWTKLGYNELPRGGQLHVTTQFARTDSVQHEQILRELPAEALQPMLDGLNAISSTAWRVNKRVLALIEFMWEAYPSGLQFVPDCPSAVEMPRAPTMPPLPATDASEEECEQHELEVNALLREYREAVGAARLRQNNFHSQRISARLKLDVAAQFQHDTFYFPHNIDFRGRVYAVGPHLQYLGDDLARGLLQFAHAKPLGAEGHYWLKLQLANLYGKDKLPLDERVAWTEQRAVEGTLAAISRHPLEARAREWWMAADNPVQALQVIFELQAVEEHVARGGDASEFCSSVPVHQDGSCNGLQHYAALGRDRVGAAQVNLVPADRPSDVYSGVTTLVQERVATTAAELLSSELESDEHADSEVAAVVRALTDAERAKRDQEIGSARKLDGLISRKVVKQTVMTSVYGVTRIGARDQILNRLKDLNDVDAFETPQTRDELRQLAQYVAKLTFGSMGEVFSGATEAMGWLAEVATRISKDTNRPVVWTTPLGWPVLQPYFLLKKRRVKTPFNTTMILDPDQMDLLDDNSKAPVVKMKQRSAMPPNYVHSLDSSHMLMTATRCVADGLTFAAVHDSFWTHAADVPRMNVHIREAFVELHEATNLEHLHRELRTRFPDVRWEEVPPPPPQGDLDIHCVKESTYFFS